MNVTIRPVDSPLCRPCTMTVPQLRRPVTRSTDLRSVPTIARPRSGPVRASTGQGSFAFSGDAPAAPTPVRRCVPVTNTSRVGSSRRTGVLGPGLAGERPDQLNGCVPALGDHVLCDRREIDEAGHVHVVDADHRHVARHLRPRAARRPERTDGQLVELGEHRGGQVRSAQPARSSPGRRPRCRAAPRPPEPGRTRCRRRSTPARNPTAGPPTR